MEQAVDSLPVALPWPFIPNRISAFPVPFTACRCVRDGSRLGVGNPSCMLKRWLLGALETILATKSVPA